MITDKRDAELNNEIKLEYAAISYRTAVIPIVAYEGAAIKNSGTILTDLAPWLYLGFTSILLAFAQALQRRQRKAWPWSTALIVGFGIVAVAIIGSMTIVNLVAPWELSRD